MKQLLLAFAIITGLAACKNDADDVEKTNAVQLLPSVAAYNNNSNSDTSAAEAPSLIQAKTSNRQVKIVYITKKDAPQVVYTPAPVPVAETPSPIAPTIPTSETTGTIPTQQGSGTINDNKDVSPSVPETVKKKGWSNAAKGAAIGAGTGAIGGAILSKKKGLGAIVGGVVGAAGGYIIGKNMDKKNATK